MYDRKERRLHDMTAAKQALHHMHFSSASWMDGRNERILHDVHDSHQAKQAVLQR